MHPMRSLAAAFVLVLAAGAAQAGFGTVPEIDAGRSVVPVQTSVDEMPTEMGRAYVLDIQEQLTIRGYEPGPVDGLMGPRTRAAIRAYQRDAGLPVDGVASKELLEHILFNADSATASTGTVRGYDPDLVRAVQIELIEQGYYQGEIDGIAGSGTLGGVRMFQRKHGVVVDGIIDRELLDQLRAGSI